MAGDVPMSPELEQIDSEIHDIFRALANGFQKLDKIKDPNRQTKQLEELTGKMRECKRLIKEFDRELKDEESRIPPEVHRQLNEKKQSMVAMSNQELITAGRKQIDETDQAIERSKMVVEQTIEVGTQTATTLKGQTEQMGRIVNELDTIQFSIKKATQLVKEIGRQIVNPNNKNIRDIPGLAPPAPTARRLLSTRALDTWHTGWF
ncbi:hypothetical protein Taro_031293 [Colocasia esculenta]|uniref:t-SNARE coiled-coil homology domain-containing protein n=1 Tax=Colocasia esculenta TaxID=4460 RepID=A0A843VNJ5_COLES|nr:hypothetical protein [Colocasia esculenta]